MRGRGLISMARGNCWWVLLWSVAVVISACSRPSPRSSGADAANPPPEQSSRNTTLVMIIRDEPGTLTPNLPAAAPASKEAFPPPPRHILRQPFKAGQADAFTNHPYWTREYVGLGPYRLDRWELGASIEGAGFSGRARGPPRIERIRL